MRMAVYSKIYARVLLGSSRDSSCGLMIQNVEGLLITMRPESL